MKPKELKIGDWALFDVATAAIPNNFKPDDHTGLLIENVIGFRFFNKEKRSKQYKASWVSTDKPDEAKNVQILALWYKCYKNKIFKLCNIHLNISLDKFIGTIRPPLVQNDSGKINYVLPFEYSELNGFAEY